MSNKLTNVFFHWLPLGVGLVLFTGFTYAVVQQNYRQGLNDPQVQVVEDAVAILNRGGTPAEVVGRGEMVDISSSLSPFIAVYDKDGTPLESSGILNNAPPKPPVGVFQSTQSNMQNRVTWQPDQNTRVALVVMKTNLPQGYFVAAGRNMREVEARINNLTHMTLSALVIILFVTFLLDFFGDIYRRKTFSTK